MLRDNEKKYDKTLQSFSINYSPLYLRADRDFRRDFAYNFLLNERHILFVNGIMNREKRKMFLENTIVYPIISTNANWLVISVSKYNWIY